ncbi:hypothetical protein [Aphanothece sacrum]|uniref:Ankyrin n=1 Tax=Aphanothece sacrum FPU1 TaxID=1920663 RepID=A0A401IHR5_APHSA|nr:hypothetical protein [Aphanothece sacrum]GBF80837.1 ankyrin [Aphanothece sacrum FPU1]GBF85623.1 ankyrin2 [Aphanothece sacrum FPU3]
MNTKDNYPIKAQESPDTYSCARATQELLAIPNLLERVKQNQATPKTNYKAWRNLRSDV